MLSKFTDNYSHLLNLSQPFPLSFARALILYGIYKYIIGDIDLSELKNIQDDLKELYPNQRFIEDLGISSQLLEIFHDNLTQKRAIQLFNTHIDNKLHINMQKIAAIEDKIMDITQLLDTLAQAYYDENLTICEISAIVEQNKADVSNEVIKNILNIVPHYLYLPFTAQEYIQLFEKYVFDKI